MKRLLLTILMFCSAPLIAQESNTDTLQTSIFSKAQYSIEMGAAMGYGWGGSKMASTYVFPKAQFKINDNAQLRVGVLSGEDWYKPSKTVRNLAPYENRYKHNAITMAADYKINDKMLLSVSALYDMRTPFQSVRNNNRDLYTYGASASLWYKLSKDSFLNLTVSYLRSNDPYTLMPYYHPYLGSMGANNAVANFLWGDDESGLSFSPYHNSISNW
jgi:hypothetical protein